MLKLKNLSIIYDERIILNDVNIQFPAGKVSVIQGASGSGKSSLLNILGLMQKTNKTCKYYYNELPISDFNETKKADFRLHNIGFVFQQNNLIQELTAEENIMVSTMMSDNADNQADKAQKLLQYVGLEHVKASYPYRLSGGEEARVAIARALANDADIILADEPTASLDETNRKSVLLLLQELAHKLGKTVIIVSHDESVSEIADIIYKIEGQQVHIVKAAGALSVQQETKAKLSRKRKTFRFIRFYNKKRTSDRLLNKIFIAVTAFVAAVAILFVNFGSDYTAEQHAFINSISDKSIFLVNDSSNLQIDTDYPEALSITPTELTKIAEIPFIEKWYPYYEFLSVGFTGDEVDEAKVTITSENRTLLEKSYKNTIFPDGSKDQFAIAPLYPEEDMSFLLEYKSNVPGAKGIIVTSTLAAQLGIDSADLIDKEIEIQAFSPIKRYDTSIEQAKDALDRAADFVELKAEGSFYKLITLKQKIIGVLSASYNLQRGSTKDLFLLPEETFYEILTANKADTYGETYPGFPEKELAPSAVVIFANTYKDVSTILARLGSISPIFSIKHTATDVQAIQTNLDATKNIMMLITIVFIGIIMLMFGLLYYLKNRTRKKEVGILKALGLTKRNIIELITAEMSGIAIKSCINAWILAIIISYIGNRVFNIPLFTITPFSLSIGLLVACYIVMIAGILPIYQASKVDPIEAIRQIGK